MKIIGIAGGSGSGKTTVVSKICKKFKSATFTVLSQDNFYFDNSHIPFDERVKLNFDHPSAIEFNLMKEKIIDLINGYEIEIPTYSFVTCTRQKETEVKKAAEFLFIEGILIFTDTELLDIMDCTVFIDLDEDKRLNRIINRDVVQRGKPESVTRERFFNTVKPMHDMYIKPSAKNASLIVNGENTDLAADLIYNKIQSL